MMRVVLVLALVVGNARAQTLELDWIGPEANSAFGSDVEVVGDLTGDGFPDLVVAASRMDLGSHPEVGRLFALSGRTGQVLWVTVGNQDQMTLGAKLAALGDLDGDGVGDVAATGGVLAGYPHPTNVRVLSGVDGAQLLDIIDPGPGGTEFGHQGLSSAGDWNGDGTPDLAIGDPAGSAGGGELSIYSGATGQLMWWSYAPAASARFGQSIAALGDWDGDGLDELAVGSPGADLSASQQAVGRVVIYSSKTKQVARELWGSAPGDRFGHAVANAGDVDGDGRDDLLVSAVGADYVRVFLAPVGTPSHVLQPETASFPSYSEGFGNDLDGAGDVDGDGYDDLLVGAHGWMPVPSAAAESWGRAYVFSGATGETLFTLEGQQPQDALGRFVAGGLDGDADGYGEVALATDGHDGPLGPDQGRVQVLAGGPGVTAPFGTGPASHGVIGLPAEGGLPVRVRGAGGQPGDLVLVGLGASSLDLALPGLGTLYVQPFLTLALTADAAGAFELQVPLPASGVGGLVLHSQAWFLGATVQHSNGMTWTVAP